MKVRELLNEREIYAKKIENPESIKEISLANTESQYKVDSVIFDNKNGLGNVPYNSNVNYMGFTAIMSIDDFLNLAAPHEGQREETAKEIKELIEQGYGIATPWFQLIIDDLVDGKGNARVYGHEGRARAICCQKYFGLKEIPIHIFPVHYRSRDITTEHIEAMNKNGIGKESSPSSVIRNTLKKVFKV